MSAYGVARLDEIEKRNTWRPVREHFGIGAFETNAYQADEAPT